jgi:hypothetical protein
VGASARLRPHCYTQRKIIRRFNRVNFLAAGASKSLLADGRWWFCDFCPGVVIASEFFTLPEARSPLPFLA